MLWFNARNQGINWIPKIGTFFEEKLQLSPPVIQGVMFLKAFVNYFKKWIGG